MAIIEAEGLTIDTDKILIEDMPTPLFREIYMLCGAETAVLLLKHMTGSTITVPSKGFVRIIKRIILSDYDGTTESIRKICRMHKVTESYVRNVLKDNKINTPAEGQKSFNFSGVQTDAE